MSTFVADRSDRADRRLDLLAELARRRTVAHRRAGALRRLPAVGAGPPPPAHRAAGRHTASVTTFPNAEALLGAAGTDLGTSAWVDVEQGRIAAFADATDDHQWIHLDEERAAAGPFGTTIAHGFLTLSLLVPMLGDLVCFEQPTLVVNAGLERVRFLSPVPSGSRVRASATLTAAEQTRTGVRTTTEVTVELEGAERPALVAVSLLVYAPVPA